jgi:hypothetical protein
VNLPALAVTSPQPLPFRTAPEQAKLRQDAKAPLILFLCANSYIPANVAEYSKNARTDPKQEEASPGAEADSEKAEREQQAKLAEQERKQKEQAKLQPQQTPDPTSSVESGREKTSRIFVP